MEKLNFYHLYIASHVLLLLSLLLGTDFTCEVEPGHFYFIGRENGSPAFRKRTDDYSQDCRGVGASALREHGGVQTPMTRSCISTFRIYMFDFGFNQSTINRIKRTLQLGTKTLVQFDQFVVCRREFTSRVFVIII